MGDSIMTSIVWGLLVFVAGLLTITTKLYLTALSVLIVFSILNYWMRINIKEFLKSYFLIYFIVFFTVIVTIFYFSYDIETSRSLVFIDPSKIEKLSPQEYKIHKCFVFLSDIVAFFFISTFIMLLCLLQAYLFKCYSVGEKRKKLSWFIGFVCNILIASMYVVWFGF